MGVKADRERNSKNFVFDIFNVIAIAILKVKVKNKMTLILPVLLRCYAPIESP